ncbi:MAG: ABC transporter ATP-binding protein [SAR202 cluster bacterium]|nr:ABC transporter ATP-binding protein [SAR202 cluster bacterium]
MTTTDKKKSEGVKSNDKVVLEVKDLKTYFFNKWGTVKAVDGISFFVRQGETIGIVGESGCGKTMTSLSLLRLNPKPASRIIEGEIILDGQNILDIPEQEMRSVRGRKISMILQDPQTSLNPVYTVGNQLVEALAHRKDETEEERDLRKDAEAALRSVRVAAPDRRLHDFPHQMSGGMKQRVVGAIAMACDPMVIIADEPTTALDVTIQLQYLRLLKDLQARTGMSIIFITHDFGIVARMCDRVAVMYAGRIVEEGPVREIFNNPAHPYTEALIGSVPKMEEKVERLYQIEGQPPQLFNLPIGCRFAARCPYAKDKCRDEYPGFYQIGKDHKAACWRHDPIWETLQSSSK